jgi:hypothetical protein
MQSVLSCFMRVTPSDIMVSELHLQHDISHESCRVENGYSNLKVDKQIASDRAQSRIDSVVHNLLTIVSQYPITRCISTYLWDCMYHRTRPLQETVPRLWQQEPAFTKHHVYHQLRSSS